MKIVNDSIKNSLKQPTTQRKGRILVNDKYYEVFNVEYYADVYNEGNVVGNAIASQLDFDLPYMAKFDTFKYFDGVWNGTDYEYVDMGTFTVFDEKDEDEFNKHITAFDNLIKFNAPFTDNGDYPKTIFEELQNICEQAGVELVNASITNGNFELQDNQFVNNESLKSVLKAICQISGTYAIIKEDKIVLQLKNETSETINKSQHMPITWKRRTYGINQVILGLEDVVGEYVIRQDEEDIAINGVHKLVINDNPFAYTQEKRDLLIDDLFNQVKGFGYIPYELKGEWLNYMDVGDTITIDGIETIVLRINGKSPKSLESEMSAPAIIDSAIQYVDNTASIKNLMKKTEISVDKQKSEIELVTSEIISVKNDLSNKYYDIEQTNTLIQNSTDGLMNTLSSVGGNNLIRNSYFYEYENGLLTYWSGPQKVIDKYESKSRNALSLQNGTIKQSVNLTNKKYCCSFKYIKLSEVANAKFIINGKEYILDGNVDNEKKFEIVEDLKTDSIIIEFVCDTNDGFLVYEVMLNEGESASLFTQNTSESISDTVNIGKGVEVLASNIKNKTRMDADGLRGINTETNELTFYQTTDGIYGKEVETESIRSGNLIVTTRHGHNFMSGL